MKGVDGGFGLVGVVSCIVRGVGYVSGLRNLYWTATAIPIPASIYSDTDITGLTRATTLGKARYVSERIQVR